MTTPRDAAASKSTAGKNDSTKTGAQNEAKRDTAKSNATDPTDAARLELHGPGFAGATMPMVFGEDVFKRWADEVRSNPAYQLRDPNDPDSEGATGSAGSNPPPALIVEYGPGKHQYISTVFDAGQAIVQDGADESGKAWKFPERDWRRFVARVRGDELPDDPAFDGPTMHEAAAEQNARTGEALQADREATPDNRANERDK